MEATTIFHFSSRYSLGPGLPFTRSTSVSPKALVVRHTCHVRMSSNVSYHKSIIIRQPLCPVVGRKPQHAVSKLPCLLPYRVAPVFAQVVTHRLAGLPGRLFLSYGLQVVTREVVFEAVDMPCPGPFHFSHSVHYIKIIYDFGPLPDQDVGPSIFVCDVEQVCSVLVWSVSRSLHHMP